MKKVSTLLAAAALLLFSFAQCGKSSSSDGNANSHENTRTYYSTMTALTVQIFYETGATPFTGTFNSGALSGRNYFYILSQNLQSLFQGRSQTVTITVPQSTSEMSELSTQNQSGWTLTEMLSTANAVRTQSTSTHGYFFVAFVKGYYEIDGVQQTNVIGVNLSGYPIVFIFKDVVSATGLNPSGIVPKFVEQSTLVHELGHALGLVNDGVSLTTAHQDSANGAHCTNTNCVMYYLNEGKSDAVTYAQQFSTTGSVVMYGTECLNDTRSYTP